MDLQNLNTIMSYALIAVLALGGLWISYQFNLQSK